MTHKQLLVTYLVTMFAITNPFGNLGIFIALTSDRTVSEQRWIAVKTAFACFDSMISEARAVYCEGIDNAINTAMAVTIVEKSRIRHL